MKLLNKLIITIIPFLPKSFVRLVASPYIAGTTNDEMIDSVLKLNNQGYDVAIDILGEHVKTEIEAERITNHYKEIYQLINQNNLSANISIKLTHIGQDLGYDVVKKNLFELLKAAKETNNFLRIDMENSPYTSETIQLYKECIKIYDKVGIVLQAYMLRSENDLEILSDENFNVRICKGIYVEDESIVFKNFYKIRENYISLVKKGLLNNSYIAIATHDEEIINHLSSWIIENNIPNSQFEFQSLHGVPIEKKLQELLSQNFKVRIYLPFGDNWYDYSIRRLKENPKMAGYILKNLFKKIFRI